MQFRSYGTLKWCTIINLNSRLILCETLVLCDSKIFDKVQNEVQNSIKISYVPPATYVVPNIKFGLFHIECQT